MEFFAERQVDKMGRVVLPIELRAKLEIKDKEKLSVYYDAEKGRIILKKAAAGEKAAE